MPNLKSLMDIPNQNIVQQQTAIIPQIPATASRKRIGQGMVHVLLKACFVRLQSVAIKKISPNFIQKFKNNF